MSSTYRTREGDRLDLICREHYGHLDGSVEAVLAANPGLAAAGGGPYPAGVLIVLPAPTSRRRQRPRSF